MCLLIDKMEQITTLKRKVKEGPLVTIATALRDLVQSGVITHLLEESLANTHQATPQIRISLPQVTIHLQI
jgi:hypothetical protein